MTCSSDFIESFRQIPEFHFSLKLYCIHSHIHSLKTYITHCSIIRICQAEELLHQGAKDTIEIDQPVKIDTSDNIVKIDMTVIVGKIGDMVVEVRVGEIDIERGVEVGVQGNQEVGVDMMNEVSAYLTPNSHIYCRRKLIP